jgi:alkanesulfonate monooxygenase SsuD/methylene tetrahydromethanopterin reductase-like flavin-dependent oxidoreductase (luciferase family)
MFSAFGVDPDTFVARFNESLQLMKALWTEPRVTFESRFWQLRAAAMEPKPFQKPHPPIWFGGSHPNALRRAVRYANGFFGAGSQTTAQFADQVKVVRQALSEQNRDPGTFPIAKRVYIAVDDSTTRARERITAALDEQYGYFGFKGLGLVAVAGPPDACVQGLREVFDAGAEMILLNPLFDDQQQMERLAAEVMPRLRGVH